MIRIKKKNRTPKVSIDISNNISNPSPLSSSIDINEQMIKEFFKNCSDIVIRPFTIDGNVKILIAFIDGLCDSKAIEQLFLKPLLFEGLPGSSKENRKIGQIFENQLLAFASVSTVDTTNELIDGIVQGNVAILVEQEPKAILTNIPAFEQRSVEEPQTEVTIRGPRDSFTESLRTNTSLIRRRIRSHKLKLESHIVGTLTKTEIVIAYIEGVTTESLIEEVRNRIKRIQVDGVLESEIIEEFIEDTPFSLFPQIHNTERPDVVAANLLEGKIAIIVNNTPFALIVPMTFWSGLQAVDDYSERFIYMSFIRFIRFSLLLIALFLPSLYVALTTFHPELIPTDLLISIAAARENVPFPALIEALIMEFIFEGLREAGIRLPKAVGSAVSIVGALVIGQAAVQAGIVSPAMVIVVATTGIASFAIPRYNLGTALRIIRFFMLLLGGLLGLYGVVVGFIALTIHLVNLRSFGIPYFTPVAPQIRSDLKDFIVRFPRWAMNTRPAFTSGQNKFRIPKGQEPHPPQSQQGENESE